MIIHCALWSIFQLVTVHSIGHMGSESDDMVLVIRAVVGVTKLVDAHPDIILGFQRLACFASAIRPAE